ncbi:hypothetical protein CFAM422_003315 [Trichoderma lentiforme]|uniref:Uncharacterized protein n=1 Tax=Trichoderma lentiforme TaxID=1567552 RepID=A0A9P4XM82_9HYPO|nr:hypothetical protein CFAM422_003315 [Trichoderma lentiforme]
MSSALWPLDADAAAASQARMQPVQPPLRLPARFSYPVMVMNRRLFLLSLYSQLVSEIQISHLRQRFSALCGGCQPPSPVWSLAPIDPPFGRPRSRPFSLSNCPSVNKSAARGSIWGRLGSETPALTDTSIIRQDPAKETSDHAEVGLGLGWHRVQSPRPTREGQKWSEGHSDVVRMQRKAVLLAIPATANPSRRGIASRITASLCPIESTTPLIHCRPLDSSSIFDLLKMIIYIYPPASARMQVQKSKACIAHIDQCHTHGANLANQRRRIPTRVHRDPPSPTALCKAKQIWDKEAVVATAAAESSKAVIQSKQNLEPRGNRGDEFRGQQREAPPPRLELTGRWGQHKWHGHNLALTWAWPCAGIARSSGDNNYASQALVSFPTCGLTYPSSRSPSTWFLQSEKGGGGDIQRTRTKPIKLLVPALAQTTSQCVRSPMPNQGLAPRSGCEEPLTRMHLCQTGVFLQSTRASIPPFGTLEKKDRKSKELEKKKSKSGFARVFELDPPPSANAIGPSV